MSEHPVPGEGFWYLGGPYSDSIHERYNQHMVSAYFLTRSGLTVFSPIVHYHLMAQKYSLPTDAAFWEHNNHNIIIASKGMILLEIPNWKQSKGVKKEILLCQMKGLPVWGIKVPSELTFEWTRLF
jgi:hypothetical protein